MNKKIILSIALLTLLSLVVFVSATRNIMERQENGPYMIQLELVEGWNIIAGTMPVDGILSDSEIQASDIGVVWYYSPKQKKYLQVYPNMDLDELRLDDDDFVFTSAMWVYSNKNGTIRYSTLEDYPSLGNRELYAGYNFVTMTPDMFKGVLDEAGYEDEYFSWGLIEGTCNIEKVYVWMYPHQEWDDFSSFKTSKIPGYDFDDFLGNGMLVKVTNDCKLGEIQEEILSAPPVLP